jgi:hypothetical protein
MLRYFCKALNNIMARDSFHLTVRKALEKDGWSITHDPYELEIGGPDYEIDLGAEKIFAAQKGPKKIAVEVKFLPKNLPPTSSIKPSASIEITAVHL